MINLKDLLKDNPDCEANAYRLSKLLSKVYPTEKAKTRVLVDILDCGIAGEIKNLKFVDKTQADKFVAFLENDYGYSPKIAKECIEIWADFYAPTQKKATPPLKATTRKTTSPAKKHEATFIYCKVRFFDAPTEKSYYYLTNDKSIQAGDTAIVAVGKDNREKPVKVESVEAYSDPSKYPYPPEETKYILKKIDRSRDLTILQALIGKKVKTPYGEGIINNATEAERNYEIEVKITFPWGKTCLRTFTYGDMCLTCSLLNGAPFPRVSIPEIKDKTPHSKGKTRSPIWDDDDDDIFSLEEETFESSRMDMGYLEDFDDTYF